MRVTPDVSARAVDVPDAHAYRLGYRADIEGLRAVAIALVVAAHAGVPWLAGGFVGVDVFFVLSGYLITGLLVQEIRTTGHVRLFDFYARRLRRLLPALLLMVIGTALLAAVLLAPFEQPEQARAASAASVWLSNLHFVFSRLDYFGPAAGTNLFLHTWSLGVEEQFYLVWPVLVLFLVGSWQWQGATRNWQRLRGGMLAAVGLCLALSVFLTYTQPAQGFYLMPSRAWQFALGAVTLLAFSDDGTRVGPVTRWLAWASVAGRRTVGGWIGLALVLGAGLLLDTHYAYPGGWALLPSVGTALILAAGTQASARGVGSVLSRAPLRRLGQVSYAWYLWHWPILILGATVTVMGRPAHPVLLVGVSLGLAFVSYHLVEAPVRHSRVLSRRPLMTLALSLVLMAATAVLGARWQDEASGWALLPQQQAYSAVRSDLPALYGMAGCDEWFQSSRVQVCGFGPADATHTALLIGDSVTMQWFPAAMQAYGKPGWRVLVITKSACPLVDEAYFYPRIGRTYVECSVWRDAALAAVRSLRPDVVLMGSTTTYPFTEAQWVNGSRRVLDVLAPAAGRVFIIRATPGLPFDGPGCLARRAWRSPRLPAPPACSAPAGSAHSDDIHAWVSRAAGAYPNVQMLDLNPLVCPNDVCDATRNGEIVFRDSMHLTARYIKSLGDAFAEQVGMNGLTRAPAGSP